MSTDSTNTVTAFPTSGNGRSFPKMSLRKADPRLEAVLGKLVPVSDARVRNGENQSIRPPDQGILQKISDDNAQASIDAKNLLQVLPDIDLSMLILISSILSPKDMVTTELTFKVDSTIFTSELTGQLIQLVREHFESTYKITDLLPEILKDVLFMTGSYALAVLPESTIDDVINSPDRVAMESIRGEFLNNDIYPLQVLGNAPDADDQRAQTSKLGLESLEALGTVNPSMTYSAKVNAPSGVNAKLSDAFNYVTIVDNPNVLKMPHVRAKIRSDRIQEAYDKRSMSMESYKKSRDEEGSKPSMYRRRRYKATPILAVRPASMLERPTFGNPLVMHLPSESVIPVHVPGSPEDHIGYFVLLDENGNPVNRVLESDYYRDLSQGIDKTQQSSNLINSARQGFTGINRESGEELKRLDETYADLMEAELKNRLRFGLYGDDVEISKDHQIYRIMLSRAMSKMHTQVLYIPEEIMTYIAFEYNAHGIGISLLEKSKIIGSLRATLMFANTMASIKNSLGRTLLNITLEPEDPDPSTTVEFLINEHAKNTRSQLPVGISNPADIITALNNAAVDVAVSGNTRYPETKLEIEDKQSNRPGPNTELEESMRKRHIQSLGLSPEMVDNSGGVDFAQSIIQNNLLLSKRVMMYQKMLTQAVSEFVRKYTLNSQDIMDKLRELIDQNRDKLSKAARETMVTEVQRVGMNVKSGQKTSNSYTMQEGGLKETLLAHALDRVLFDFVLALEVSLPDPDLLTLKNQSQAFADYTTAVKDALNAYIDASFIDNNAAGEISTVVEATKAALLAHYQRQWLRENNLFPELEQLVTEDDDGTPGLNLIDVVEGHNDGLQKTIVAYMEKVLANRKANEAKLKAAEATSGISLDGSSGGGGGFDAGGDAGGGDAAAVADPFASNGVDDALGALGNDPPPDDTDGDGETDASSTDVDEQSSSSTSTDADGTTTTSSSSSSTSSGSSSAVI